MKLNKIFLSMAALAFLGAMTVGCSGDDLAAETPQLPNTTNGTVVTKVTVSLDEHASTRMLDPTGLKTFEEGDKIAVIYKNTAGVTVKAESDPLQATDLHDAKKTGSFSVTLTNPQANTPVRYIYPAAMAADDVSATTPDNDATIKWSNLASQYGSFAFISEHVDLAVFDGTMTAQAVLPAATLENPLTIGAFTITNSATNDKITENVKKLIVNDGTNTYTLEGGWSTVIFVAMKPISKTQTVTIKAITADNKFIKSVTNKELAKNTKYDIDVSMTARYPFAATDTKLSSEDIGSVIGADGKIYMNATAAAAASPATTAVAMITYVGAAGTADASSTSYKGLALALSDANSGNIAAWCSQYGEACLATQYASYIKTNDMAGIANTDALIGHGTHVHNAATAARNYNSGTHPTGTSAWFLPSAGQWEKMVTAAGGYSTLMINAGLQSYIYWSSTEYGDYEVWEYSFYDNFGIGWGSDFKTYTYYVRSALAF